MSDFNLYEHMPPYHYDTADFVELRKAYDVAANMLNIAGGVIESATTPMKWNEEILDEWLAILNLSHALPEDATVEQKRELILEYLRNIRYFNDAAFRFFLKLANPSLDESLLHLTIHRGRNVFIRVAYDGSVNVDGELMYDRLMDMIREIYPIGWRYLFDIDCGSTAHTIYYAAYNATAVSIVGHTTDKAYGYYRVRLYTQGDSPSVRNIYWDSTIEKYYVDGVWLSKDELSSTPYGTKRAGDYVSYGVATSNVSVIAEDRVPGEPIGVEFEGLDAFITVSLDNGSAIGDWSWVKETSPQFDDISVSYDAATDRTIFDGVTTPSVRIAVGMFRAHQSISSTGNEFPMRKIDGVGYSLRGWSFQILSGTAAMRIFYRDSKRSSHMLMLKDGNTESVTDINNFLNVNANVGVIGRVIVSPPIEQIFI